MQAILTIENGSQRGQRRWIRRGEQLSIGSSVWADLVLETAQLLPIHMLLELSDAGCVMHSVNDGRFVVNDTPRPQAHLSDGDLIRAGDVVLRVALQNVPAKLSKTRVDAPPKHVLPQRYRITSAPDVIRAEQRGERYVRFVPTGDGGATATQIAQRVMPRLPLYALCRFDRWSFPAPPELADCYDSVPAVAPEAIQFVPLLFKLNRIENVPKFLAEGLAAGSLLLLGSSVDQERLLAFLRSQGGLYLSPSAMRSVLTAAQTDAIGAILGPIECILLGDDLDWELLALKSTFSSIQSLGFSTQEQSIPPALAAN